VAAQSRGGALESYQASLEISAREYDQAAQLLSAQSAVITLEAISTADSSNSELQRGLAARADGMAAALKRGLAWAGALDLYKESLAIRQRIAAAKPSDLTAQLEPHFSEVRIGETLMEMGHSSSGQKDWSSALESYQAALDIVQKAAAADAANTTRGAYTGVPCAAQY
jgi:tetratricopeptide (TPR) repeat protein